MNTISINGVTITAGRSINIRNGKITVDGGDVTPDAKQIKIEITGNVERLEADCCETITVNGDCGPVSTQSGDVKVGGAVSGPVQTMSGSVVCGSVGGSVSTMSGSVVHR
jgi:hypothetical protein